LVTVAPLHDGVEIILQEEAINTPFESSENLEVVSIEQQLCVSYISSVIYKYYKVSAGAQDWTLAELQKDMERMQI